MKVYSETTKKDYELVVYVQKTPGEEETIVITHRSLNDVFTGMPDEDRPSFEIEPFDVSQMPGTPPMYAVKGIMAKGDVRIEALGEMLCIYWQDAPEITRKFPLTICKNIAFDRCFLQYMRFRIEGYNSAYGIYSSSEIDISGGKLLSSKSVPSEKAHGMSQSNMPGQNANVIQVLNVSRDPSHPIATLATTAGNLYYNGQSNKFASDGSIDVSKINLNDIYQQASNLIRKGLREYLLGN